MLWQQYILNQLEADLEEDRIINWFFNPEGDVGKTKLTHIIGEDYNGCILSTTNIKDALCALDNFIDERSYPKVIMLDIVRSAKQTDSIYDLIEVLKGGKPTTGKYKSRILNFPFHPVIIVFANYEPEIGKLTDSRWIVHVSNYNGESFDFTFRGIYGKKYIDAYNRLEYIKQAANEELGQEYIPVIPKSQELDIKYFFPVMQRLSRDTRIHFWERGMIPIVEIAFAPTTETISIREQPMTEQEKEDYIAWKKSRQSGEGTIKMKEWDRRLNVAVDKAAVKYIEGLKKKISAANTPKSDSITQLTN